jgi:hypothetical protein
MNRTEKKPYQKPAFAELSSALATDGMMSTKQQMFSENGNNMGPTTNTS